MARPLRIEYPGAYYHVTSRGNEQKAIFKDDSDREKFLDIVARAVNEFSLRCHGYVLMNNHYHLLIADQLQKVGVPVTKNRFVPSLEEVANGPVTPVIVLSIRKLNSLEDLR